MSIDVYFSEEKTSRIVARDKIVHIWMILAIWALSSKYY